jgi:hypothetical protein
MPRSAPATPPAGMSPVGGWPRLADPTGSALGFDAGILATLLAWLTAAGVYPEAGLVPLAAVAVGVGACTTVPGALAAAAQRWGLYCGFELYRFGELRLDGPSRNALVTLLGLAVAASLLGRVVRAVRATSRRESHLHAASRLAPPVLTRSRPAVSHPRPGREG